MENTMMKLEKRIAEMADREDVTAEDLRFLEGDDAL